MVKYSDNHARSFSRHRATKFNIYIKMKSVGFCDQAWIWIEGGFFRFGGHRRKMWEKRPPFVEKCDRIPLRQFGGKSIMALH